MIASHGVLPTLVLRMHNRHPKRKGARPPCHPSSSAQGPSFRGRAMGVYSLALGVLMISTLGLAAGVERRRKSLSYCCTFSTLSLSLSLTKERFLLSFSFPRQPHSRHGRARYESPSLKSHGTCTAIVWLFARPTKVLFLLRFFFVRLAFFFSFFFFLFPFPAILASDGKQLHTLFRLDHDPPSTQYSLPPFFPFPPSPGVPVLAWLLPSTTRSRKFSPTRLPCSLLFCSFLFASVFLPSSRKERAIP